MKLGNLLRSPKLYRSFILPYFQVVLYAFSKSKKTAMKCCFASLMEISNRTTWFIVDLWLLKLHWELVIRLLDSINQTNFLLTIQPMVLKRQLASVIGDSLNGTKRSSALQYLSKTWWPIRRWPSRSQKPFGLKSVFDLEISVARASPAPIWYLVAAWCVYIASAAAPLLGRVKGLL